MLITKGVTATVKVARQQEARVVTRPTEAANFRSSCTGRPGPLKDAAPEFGHTPNLTNAYLRITSQT